MKNSIFRFIYDALAADHNAFYQVVAHDGSAVVVAEVHTDSNVLAGVRSGNAAVDSDGDVCLKIHP